MPPSQGAARTPANAGTEARRQVCEGVRIAHTGGAGNLEGVAKGDTDFAGTLS